MGNLRFLKFYNVEVKKEIIVGSVYNPVIFNKMHETIFYNKILKF